MAFRVFWPRKGAGVITVRATDTVKSRRRSHGARGASPPCPHSYAIRRSHIDRDIVHCRFAHGRESACHGSGHSSPDHGHGAGDTFEARHEPDDEPSCAPFARVLPTAN